MKNNGDKLMLGKLEGQVEMICQRMEKIEKKTDNIEKQLNQLNNFNAKIVGASMTVATIVSLVMSYLKWGETMNIKEKLTIFRDNMVKSFKSNPEGKYYKVIGWANNYSPILDVTARVKEVIPTVQKATLTIYGDDPLKLSYEARNTPYPDKTSGEIVSGWMGGYEEQRQKDPQTGLYALVRFPAKLELKGGLPPTHDVKFEGKPPQISIRNIGNDWYGKQIIAIDHYRKRILTYLTIDDYRGDAYNHKIILRINNKDYTLYPYRSSGWRVINYETKAPTKAMITRVILGKYYRDTVNINLPSTGSAEDKISITSQAPKDYPGMIVGAAEPARRVAHILKDIINTGVYDITKSKWAYATRIDGDTLSLPRTIPEANLIETKKIWGYDLIRRYCKSIKGGYAWIGLWPKNQAISCTKEDHRTSYLNYTKKEAVELKDQYTPVLDVTKTVKQVIPETTKATLEIHTKDLTKIKISAPYDNKPPAFEPKEIIEHWQNGEEWVRMYCEKDKKWYYVIFPCKLTIDRPPVKPTEPPITAEPVTEIPKEAILLAIPALVGGAYLLHKK